MSHFSEVKTQLKNTEVLKRVLTASGFQVIDSTEAVEVRGYMGECQKADFKILTKTHYDIGFRKAEDGNYELVGDWELMPQVADIEQGSFTNWLKREYARESILSTAKEQGYEVEEVEDQETGQIQIVVKKW
jgi:hypothetical protein